MNKFVKYGTIIGFVLVLTGTGVSAAAFAMGASFYKIGRFMEERFDSSYQEYYSDYGYENHGPVYGTAEQGGVPEVTDQYSSEAGGQRTGAYFDGGWHAEFVEVTSLDIEQSSGTVEVLYSEGLEYLTVDCDRGSIENTSYMDDGSKKKLSVRVIENAHYIIHIPSEWTLEELEADVVNGRFEGENLQAMELELHVTGGSAEVFQAAGGTVDLECENGELNWTGTGEVIPMIDAESDNSGTINIAFSGNGEGEFYSYKLETHNGTISLPDLILEGDSNKKIPNSSGEGIIDLEAKNNGTIVVVY